MTLIPQIETKSLKEINKYQESRLPEMMTYLSTHSKFYKDHFRAKLRVVPQIIFKPPDYIAKMSQPEGGRKTIKFIDRRNHH